MTDIVDDLREIAETPVGSMDGPKCLNIQGQLNWAVPLKRIAKDAADEIERLRIQIADMKVAVQMSNDSALMTSHPSFSAIKKQIREGIPPDAKERN